MADKEFTAKFLELWKECQNYWNWTNPDEIDFGQFISFLESKEE